MKQAGSLGPLNKADPVTREGDFILLLLLQSSLFQKPPPAAPLRLMLCLIGQNSGLVSGEG